MGKNDLVSGMRTYITELCEGGHHSTAKSYQDALNSFMRFSGRKKIPYTYINKENLLFYQNYLEKRGCARNTVSTYMRRLRCIYNRAVDAGEAPYIPHLFKGVFTGVESKRKKALNLDMLHVLMMTPVEDVKMRKTQGVLCLMFLFCGMAFVDLAHLKRENIKNGLLAYYRQKTGTSIQVEIPVEALSLLESLTEDITSGSPFLLPFLSGTKSGEAAYREYTSALSRFNRDLKSLAKILGITCPVTSYSIRHSFATTLKEQDVSIEMISELLGHKSIKTTQIYLKSFSLEKISAVNKACFERLYNYVPKVG